MGLTIDFCSFALLKKIHFWEELQPIQDYVTTFEEVFTVLILVAIARLMTNNNNNDN
jgi:hypothetical protein